jgi:hypothetical protein
MSEDYAEAADRKGGKRVRRVRALTKQAGCVLVFLDGNAITIAANGHKLQMFMGAIRTAADVEAALRSHRERVLDVRFHELERAE